MNLHAVIADIFLFGVYYNKVNGVIVSGSAGTLANVGTYADDVIGLKSGAHQLASTSW